MKKILTIIMVMLVCFAGCEAAGPRPPIELPFAIHQVGATVSTELRIVEKGPYRYPFDLKFMFNEKDKKDRERVLKLVVTAQNLKDIPELADTKVFFTIYNPRK